MILRGTAIEVQRQTFRERLYAAPFMPLRGLVTPPALLAGMIALSEKTLAKPGKRRSFSAWGSKGRRNFRKLEKWRRKGLRTTGRIVEQQGFRFRNAALLFGSGALLAEAPIALVDGF